MNILVVGAGLSGCSLARLLKDIGHIIKKFVARFDNFNGYIHKKCPFGT